MSINIKNPRTHGLVRELAAATGLTQTAAVELAVREQLRRSAEPPDPDDCATRKARILQIGADYRRRLPQRDRKRLAGGTDALYDELGLPQW
ncbi:MAG: type II toxin-antitoxin system VapB family antitoxin [Bifidobacteriaceae bacterium]|nr:type II toxin-antitoxin system VapB family antitoxin [Bifidobacteriaceae bacterium]